MSLNIDNKKTIIFILTSIVNTNSIKRIDEFIERGYNVRAYGFDRELDVPNKSNKILIKTVGTFKNDLSYLKRIGILYKGIRSILKENKDVECLYYLIGMDVGVFFRILSRASYLYEEADMVHLNSNVGMFRKFGERIDKLIIKHSILSVFRSEGFVKYHFGEKIPNNIYVISNRISVNVLNFKKPSFKDVDVSHLRIGYVGFIRYSSIFNFAKVFCSKFPQHEFHFWGTFINDYYRELFSTLEEYSNCFFHGPFKSPDELSKIYKQIDLVLSTYDISSENVRYAEPNKIYEAIYYKTPIIVSSGTYLAEKVRRLGIGFELDAMRDVAIIDFINNIKEQSINESISRMREIPPNDVINDNSEFFTKIEYEILDKAR